ncbi:hypothetical protein PPYR_00719 [Photinus pyralis]|uniref:Uncharacterized protein n=1 Tax=Photinus pyralis TaxID=7054 RepID=A0A5N4B2B5_PHOPY|nr:hypothetical protein PPYR_00719 [Photinus pyralis]
MLHTLTIKTQLKFYYDIITFDKSTLYKPEMVLVLKVHGNLPEFGILRNIFVMEDVVYFLVSATLTLNFNEKYQAYEIKDNDQLVVINYNDLCDNFPLVKCLKDDVLFVILKHVL